MLSARFDHHFAQTPWAPGTRDPRARQYGVKPLSVHFIQTMPAQQIRTVEVVSGLSFISDESNPEDCKIKAADEGKPFNMLALSSCAITLRTTFSRESCFNVSGRRENALGILEQRAAFLAFDAVVQAPQQGSNGPSSMEVLAHDVLFFRKMERHLGQAVTDIGTSLLQSLFIAR